MFKRIITLGLLSVAGGAFADSVSPATFSADLMVGESVTIKKTVTVSREAPTTAPVDVYFLADETGSMGGVIASVKAGAASIMTSVAGLGDIHFAVGGYRDVGSEYPSTGNAYRLISDFTGSTVATQAGINAWAASGGGDWPEAQLFGLERAATSSSWRSGSSKILVWFGDAPGHDPRSGSTMASAIGALNAKDIDVIAVDVGNMNSTGQAAGIASATGGSFYAGINAGSIVSTISAAIATSIATYSTVGLGVSGLGAGVGVTIAPPVHVGSWDRSEERTFSFAVTFTGLVPGADESFVINALVDGGVVAVEKDHITVAAIPEPGTMALMGFGLFAMVGLARRRK